MSTSHHHHRGAAHAPLGHRHTAGRGVARNAPGLHGASSPRALGAVAGATAPGHGARSSANASQHGTSQHPAKPARSSPLVTTITKIANVVPLPVRLLLGLLLSLSLALATRSRIAALRARKLERQRGELLEDVGLLQAALLPEAPERVGVVGTSAAYRPADGPGAGGDFYDVFALGDGRVAVILGDISGHGRQALPHTALVRFTLRAYLEAGLSPRVAVQTAGSVLERQLGESFATVVVATYNPHERTLIYACAGHPPPLVLAQAGEPGAGSLTPITICASPPIGTGIRTGMRQTTVSVPGESQVCFYTDGVTEARIDGELFGARRLTLALADLGPEASASQLLERVAQATDTRNDDMASCVLNIAGDATAPSVLLEELELDWETPTRERAERLLLACGVPACEVEGLVDAARRAAGHAGTAVIEVDLAGPRSRAEVRRDNVAHLPTVLAKPRAALGAAQ